MQQEGVTLDSSFSACVCVGGGGYTRREKKHNFVVKIKTAISESSKSEGFERHSKIKMNGCFLSLDKTTP